MKLIAKAYRDGLRYEKDLPQHFAFVPLYDVFPPWRETDAAHKHWCNRIIDERTNVEIYNRNTQSITAFG
jgi:hypothetical protein